MKELLSVLEGLQARVLTNAPTRKYLSADEVVALIKTSGGEFKANWTGAWDRVEKSSNPKVVIVNARKGFQRAVAVNVGKGKMIYIPDFMLDTEPSDTNQFLFYCDDGIYMEGL